MRIHKLKSLLLFPVSILAFSCATSIPISLLCNEQQVQIFVDGEYIGNGLVNYIVPKGTDYILVTCKEKGMEIYRRRLYVKDKKNQLLELTIPKDYRYSSEQTIKPHIK